MPLDLPRTTQSWSTEDDNEYQKLPFYLVEQQLSLMPRWQVWNTLFGSVPWEKNMGTTMRGVIPENSPLQRQMFYPNAITAAPNRDVHSVLERTNEAVLYRHNYESPFFSFLPSFQDFMTKQVGRKSKDLNMQVIAAQDQFVRTNVFHQIPHVYIPGKGNTNNGDDFDGGNFLAAPSGIGNTADTGGKSLAWRQALVSYVTAGLTFRGLDEAVSILEEDLQAPVFEGAQGVPKANEYLKGKYCVIGSNEALRAMRYDDFVLGFNQNVMDVNKHAEYVPLAPNLTWKSERFPLRMASDGSFPAPQIRMAADAAYNANETIPNPAYTAAPIEFAFVLGGYCFDTLQVGPAPADFASPMSENKFHKLDWNGRVRLISPTVLNYAAEGATEVIRENKYGEYLQLIADTVHGIVPNNKRHAILVPFLRTRVETP